MRMLSVIKYSSIVYFIVIILSCDRKEALTTERSQKQIKIIIESMHNPIEIDGEVESLPEISEHSFIIKSVFNRNGDLLNNAQFNSRGNIEGRVIHTYDEKNNLVESVMYDIKGISGRRIYKFDDLNKLIESDDFDAYEKKIGKQTIRFDSGDRKMVVVHKWGNGTFVKTSESLYNQHDQNIENLYFSDNRLIRKEINQYDSQGNRIETIQYYPSKNEQRTVHFKFDSLHNLIETVVLNSSLMIESKVITNYDEQHNIMELFTYGIKGNLKEYVKHRYEYDETGNWTKDITFINKKPVSVRIRKIEYY